MNNLFSLIIKAMSLSFIMGLIIFIIAIIIYSDIFIKRVLSNIPGAVHLNTPTNKGTIINSLILGFTAFVTGTTYMIAF